MTIPVLVCIDVEPEPRLLDRDRPPPWRGFEETHRILSAWRDRLASATGSTVRFSWFLRMDPQIEEAYGTIDWAVERHAEILEELRWRGDELGLHVHAFRWNEGRRTWVVDHGDASWVDHCVRSAFEGFERSLGFACRSFRFGDRFSSPRVQARLEGLGCRFDLTPEPGHPSETGLEPGEISTGRIPDWGPHGRVPYERAGGLVVIPVTTGTLPRDWFGRPRFAALRRTLRRALGRDGANWIPRESLNLGRPVRHTRFVVEQALASLERPYLCAVLRTSTSLAPARRAELEAILEYLTNHLRVEEFRFDTPAEALEHLS